MRTTLKQIRAHRPCHDDWEKLLRGLGKAAADDEPLWIDTVLDHNGLEDALWCLRSVEGCDREIQRFAVWCARRVRHLLTDPRIVAALDVAERHARGEASDEELEAARGLAAEAALATWAAARDGRGDARQWAASAAYAAAASAAYAAAYAAAWAVPAASAAWAAEAAVAAVASAADRDTERAAQAEELRRVCRVLREAKS
jgi:hypothetical protein